MSLENFQQIKNIHFVGIGGIGLSAIARMLKLEGKNVSGSDASESENLERLRNEGIEIFLGHVADHVREDTELVVYTIALSHNNPELEQARAYGIPTMTYPEALGLLSNPRFTVAVSGTHGKTTTTAMLARLACEAKLDPTVIVGSLLKDTHTNFIHGNSDLFIVEACEYRRSFLNIAPDVVVITNVDVDHLDYYNDLSDIQSAFKEFVARLPENGKIVCDPSQPNVIPVISGYEDKVIDYTTYAFEGELKVPGAHNVLNAQAALAVADVLSIDRDEAASSLEGFEGTWRRSEFVGEMPKGSLVYDDYAHHPTEIRSTLEGFREAFPERHITAVFQPHLFSRTKQLLEEFSTAFVSVDEVIVLPIYAAREPDDPEISSHDLVMRLHEKGSPALEKQAFDEVIAHLKQEDDRDRLFITMGAGDVYKISHKLIE